MLISTVTPLISHRVWDWSNLGGGGHSLLVVAERLDVQAPSLEVLVRVHSLTLAGTSPNKASVQIGLESVGYSDEEPETTFVGEELMTMTIGDADTAPSLRKAVPRWPWGSTARLLAFFTQGSDVPAGSTSKVGISIDLVRYSCGTPGGCGCGS